MASARASTRASQYHVGIVCALKEEKAAVIATFDERHDRLESKDSRDENSYTLGRIHRHNVVLACLPAGVIGTNAAAGAAKDMLRTFRNMRVALLVGIGGGIPDLTQSTVRLGDVVVSEPIDNYSGVVQYDLIKLEPGGKSKHKGALNKPRCALLTALNSLKAHNIVDDSQVQAYIDEAIHRRPDKKNKYTFPGVDKDRLQCSSCDLSQLWWPVWLLMVLVYALFECRLCSNGQVPRQGRESTNPKIHYGIIASGNQVIKDVKQRDRLGRELKAKCVEMEAAGIMDMLDCIVIRGIADYADSVKNDDWQNYAAIAAAAFAKELLLYVDVASVNDEDSPVERLGILQGKAATMKELLEETKQHNHKVKTQVTDEEHWRCLQTFKTSTYEMFKDRNDKPAPNTCQWALKHQLFGEWKDSTKNDLLWISADPGCGKSVLSRALVDDVLPSVENHCVCYFFFKDYESQNSLSIALCAMLHQLFSFAPQLINYAIPSWKRNRPKITDEVAELWRILLSVINDQGAPNITCVFDALDECRSIDRNRLVRDLISFYRESSENRALPSSRRRWLKFLVTSRPYDEICHEFQLPPSMPAIRIRGEDDNEMISQEINTVIKIRVGELASKVPRLSLVGRNRVEDHLCRMEHRTYLWLELALEYLKDKLKNSLRPDTEELNDVPSKVDDAYEKILAKIRPGSRHIAKFIFQIIVGAKRPLTIGEMAIALGISNSPQATTLHDAKLDEHGLVDSFRDICGLFIFVKDSRVHLFHQTAKEFLICACASNSSNGWWKGSLIPTEMHKLMASICIDFLCFEDIQQSAERLQNRLGSFWYFKLDDEQDCVESFIEYSATNWADHYRDVACFDHTLFQKSSRMYEVGGAVFGRWFPLFWSAYRYPAPQPKITKLGLAAANGHDDIIKTLLDDEKVDIDAKDDKGYTALTLALKFNRVTTSRLLFSKHADGSIGTHDCMPICESARGGYLDMVKLLLQQGVAVDTASQQGTALYQASKAGHREVVELLLNEGADIEWHDETPSLLPEPGSALDAASYHGHLTTVELLLDRGSRIEGNELIRSPLCHAAANGHLQVAELLLKRGANIKGKRASFTPLYDAAGGGHLEIVRFLLDKGAVLEGNEDWGKPLCGASSGGHVEIIEFLLDRGAKIDGSAAFVALCGAISSNQLRAVEILLDRGADIEGNQELYSPLYLAAEKGYLATASLLLDRGAKVGGNAQVSGETPLYIAAWGGIDEVGYGNAYELPVPSGGALEVWPTGISESPDADFPNLIKLLLSFGANINEVGPMGTALACASWMYQLELVRLLLDEGADLNIAGPYGTPLHLAAQSNNVEGIKLLLDKGANIDAQGPYGTALLVAKYQGNLEVVELLINRGASTNFLDISGDALNTAIRQGRRDVVEYLLGHGAGVNVSNELLELYRTLPKPYKVMNGFDIDGTCRFLAMIFEKCEHGQDPTVVWHEFLLRISKIDFDNPSNTELLHTLTTTFERLHHAIEC